MLGHVCAHGFKPASKIQQSFSTKSHVIPEKLCEVELPVKKGNKQVLGPAALLQFPSSVRRELSLLIFPYTQWDHEGQ